MLDWSKYNKLSAVFLQPEHILQTTVPSLVHTIVRSNCRLSTRHRWNKQTDAQKAPFSYYSSCIDSIYSHAWFLQDGTISRLLFPLLLLRRLKNNFDSSIKYCLNILYGIVTYQGKYPSEKMWMNLKQVVKKWGRMIYLLSLWTAFYVGSSTYLLPQFLPLNIIVLT